ncbi:unnamed protein product [Parnassius apollo]|uniref:(apollo) hypothetical protein n=1 Tax=Parnassius apollo TaxID=110799 RepID=A0A8S3X498_PARAO|nr:unnamed protein product [Parnassius apollo]
MFAAVYTEPVTETSQLTTLPINKRIEELKQKHQPNIQLRRVPFASVVDTEDSEDNVNYESEQSRDFVITPIVSTDRKKTKYKATETTAFKSTPKSKTGKGHTTQSHALHSNLNASLSKIKKKHLAKPAEVFYRRYEDEETRDEKWKWAHCQDMVTPFLTGIKKETNELKRLSIRDPTVLKYEYINI